MKECISFIIQDNVYVWKKRKKYCRNDNLVFWHVMQCELVETYQHFGGTYSLHLQGGNMYLRYVIQQTNN